jgi:phosphoserine phosphatase
MALLPTQRDIERRLTEWGLALEEGGHPPASKNRTLLCRHASGKRVLVKIADGHGTFGVIREGDILERLTPLVDEPECPLQIPTVFSFDRLLGLLAVEWLAPSETLFRYHRRTGRYGEGLARQVGRAMAHLHRMSRAVPERFGSRDAFRDEADLLECFLRLRPDFFARLSAAGIDFFGRIQRDVAATRALEKAFEAQRRVEGSVLLHGDMRQANLLRVQGERGTRLVVLDWELAFWGDPARDLGSLISDYALGLLAPEHPEERLDVESLQSVVRALLAGYRQGREPGFAIDAEFLRRVVWWVGVALLIYVFGITHYEGAFNPRSVQLTDQALSMLSAPGRWTKRLLGGLP